MQIAYLRGSPCSPGAGPTLWERYAVATHPGKPASVNDPSDAIYTAARILRQDKGAPPTGGTYNEYHQAACNYFGACRYATVSYADEVMARAIQYGFTGAGSPTNKPPARPTHTPQSDRCNASIYTPKQPAANRSSKSPKANSDNTSTHPPPTAPSTGHARSGARYSWHGYGSTRA